MKVKIFKSTPKGEVIAPPSKSYSHRYLIGAALSNKQSKISNIYFSNDIKATLNCLSSFGCAYMMDNESVIFKTNSYYNPNPVFDCYESGSTLRFMIPIALTKYKKVLFKGSEKLLSRGIKSYEKIFAEKEIKVSKSKDGIEIEGELKSGEYVIDGSISSQFITGLLFALPLLDGDSEIKILPPINSKNYIDITLDVLKNYSIKFEVEGNTIKVYGNQKYVAFDKMVEGDYSNAAFLDAFNYFGGNINVSGLNKSSLQGDKVYQDYFKLLDKENPTIDISNCIDMGPAFLIFAALKNGATFTGTKRLKIKESDRALAMKLELEKIGSKIDIYDDSVVVYKQEIHAPNGSFSSHNDHRIAMALSLLSIMYDIEIIDAEAINKSYPNYFIELEKMGVKISYVTK